MAVQSYDLKSVSPASETAAQSSSLDAPSLDDLFAPINVGAGIENNVLVHRELEFDEG